MHLQKVLVDGEGLRTIASRLRSMAESVERIEKTIQNLIDESEGKWKGRARKEAEKDWKALTDKTVVLREELAKRAQSIEEVLEKYQETEEKNMSEVNALSVTNIF